MNSIEYIICDHCDQKFEPFYFSGGNEFGIIQDKNDNCPNCNNIIGFANPENKQSTEQKIKVFEFSDPSEIEKFGIIKYNKRPNDIEKILKENGFLQGV